MPKVNVPSVTESLGMTPSALASARDIKKLGDEPLVGSVSPRLFVAVVSSAELAWARRAERIWE